MKRPLRILLLAVAAVLPLHAQVLLNYSWSSFQGGASSLPIPDNNATGISDTRDLTSTFSHILQIKVWVQATGNFNGDLYLTLQHGSDQSILLNRPGRSTTSPFGYDDHGFDVTFQDNAPNGDVHRYRETLSPASGTPLTGLWQPDARDVDPSVSLMDSTRTSFLGVFNGKDINGEWTLFAADLSAGGQTQIISWCMQATVVPEPEIYTSFTAFLLGLACLLRARAAKHLSIPKIADLSS